MRSCGHEVGAPAAHEHTVRVPPGNGLRSLAADQGHILPTRISCVHPVHHLHFITAGTKAEEGRLILFGAAASSLDERGVSISAFRA